MTRTAYERAAVWCLSAVALAWALGGSPQALADRGHMVIKSVQPNVSVHNTGQQAIIGWNGREEVLILATDLRAAAEATVLEFLPLPAQPSEVAKGEWKAFEEVERLIAAHQPPPDLRRGARMGAEESRAVQIVFHRRIEAHDITIARVLDLDGFISWAGEYVAKHGGSFPASGKQRLRSVVDDYLRRGYRYFVFDIISVGPQTRSVPPILCRFPSDHLFFPLLVSSLDTGYTMINLFLLTPHRVDVWGTGSGLSAGFYRQAGVRYTNRNPGVPIKFSLQPAEVERIARPLRDLFLWHPWVEFTAARYRGPVSSLTRDFVIGGEP